jgi:hypothetical protein
MPPSVLKCGAPAWPPSNVPAASLQAVPDGPGPLQDAFQQADFFVVWQPIYASITVAICLQDTVRPPQRKSAIFLSWMGVLCCLS